MQEILIATSHSGKRSEIKTYLDPLSIELLDLSGHNLEEPVEDGETFTANAEIKANYYSKHTGKAVIADDSGLSIEALNGEPGIYTARWAKSDRDFKKMYNLLNKDGNTNFNARFYCVLCLKTPGSEPIFFVGTSNGRISPEPIGDAGFNFDPVFIPDGSDKTFAQMSKEEKYLYSARGDALKKLYEYLK